MSAAAMSASEAADYAPQWGSYMTSGDPGACMYGELTDKRTAAACVAFIDSDCIPIAKAGDCCGTAGACEADLGRLAALRAYLESVK